jgi:hypothetical protein
MLSVITIAAILAVLATSSFSSLQSTSLTASGNQMVDVMAMARQNSIAHDVFTAIAIKNQGQGAYGSYCLLELTRQGDWSTGTWTALTPWHFLPRGVVFESGDPFTSTSVSLPTPLPTTFPVPYQGQQIPSSSTVYQCYQPDGTLSAQPTGSPFFLRLIRGTVDASSGAFTYQGATVSGQQVSHYDLVFVANSGQTVIQRP